MTLPQDIFGVDVAKDWLDVHHLATGSRRRVATTGAALARFAATAAGALVVFEASGGWERPLAAALEKAGVAFARVNPRQARDFARATGVRPAGSPRPTGSTRRRSPAWATRSSLPRPRPRTPPAPVSRTFFPGAMTLRA